jgi:hypothetical protein
MDYGLHKDYVYVDGVPVNMYSETELGALSRFALREHAEKLNRLLKGRLSSPYGEAGCDLAKWIAGVQSSTLEPLRKADDRDPIYPRLRRSKSVSTDPHRTARGPLVQLEKGLIASSDPCVFSDGQRLITPPLHTVYGLEEHATSRASVNPLSRLDLSLEKSKAMLDERRAWESLTPWRSTLVAPGAFSRFSLKSEFELRAMNLAAQRDYSMALYQRLGGDRVGLQVPGVGEDLVGWCLGAQRKHAVDPIAEIAAVDRLDDAVGTKRYTDANGHKVSTHTKIDASGWEVRMRDIDGATSITRTLSPRGGANSPIKRTVYDPYVEGFRAKTWQDRLEGLTAGGPGLWGVRRSSMLDDPAWSCDLGPRSPINISDPLWKRSVKAVI